VNAEAAIPVESSRPRWRRRISVIMRRTGLIVWVEIAAAALLLAMMATSYIILSNRDANETLVTPLMGAVLLVANLVPAMALMVLFARRMALRRARRSTIGGSGKLHVRLVALFSVIASVPTLLVVIFASFLFQSASEFWFSAKARGMLENASAIAETNFREEVDRVKRETVTMAGDLATTLSQYPSESPQFAEAFGRFSCASRRNMACSRWRSSILTSAYSTVSFVRRWSGS
jgi:two-component system nitrogen regulation sensor histidine kinase NtrY